MERNIEIVTFTGVDEHTDIGRLRELHQQYPWTEFGVLVGTSLGGIFPHLDVVGDLRTAGVNTSIHLCGKWARAALGENVTITPSIVHALCDGFNRVQINLHADWWHPSIYSIVQSALASFADGTPCERVIVQHRGAWDQVPVQHDAIEYLFDRSEGRGEEGFEQWPEPPEDKRVGYAGGLGPHNIARAHRFARWYPESRLWFDMEGRIRTSDGWMSLDAVQMVCETLAARGA